MDGAGGHHRDPISRPDPPVNNADVGDDSAIELAAGELPGPCDGLQRSTFKEHLARAIDNLPPREKLVLALYYDEELNLKEIGEVIGVSESRVSQIHSQAAMRLRSRLSDWR